MPLVLNYNLTRPSSSFYILTKYDQEGYDVDDSTGLNISFSATNGLLEFSQIFITADSYVVGATATY